MADHAHSLPMTGAGALPDARAAALLLGRICFASDFLMFGARKFSDPSIISKLIEAHHLPGQLVYPAMTLQLVGGLCILLGLYTRFWSAAFAWFCIVAPSIFWLDNLENLTRDYAAAGGFLLLLLFGAGPLSLDARYRLGDPVATWVPALADNRALIDGTVLVARALIALPFLADVVKKLLHMDAERALLAGKGVPGDAIYLVLLIEVVCGLALLAGRRSLLAAAVLIALAVFNGFVLHFPDYAFAVFNDRFHELMLANFKNRGAATFFKDITTIGALLILTVYERGRIVWGGRAATA